MAEQLTNGNVNTQDGPTDKLTDVVERLIVATASDQSTRDKIRAEVIRTRSASKDDRLAFSLLSSSKNLSQKDQDRIRLVDVLDKESNGALREALGTDAVLLSLGSLRDFALKVDSNKLEALLGDNKGLAPSIWEDVFMLEPESVIARSIESGLLLQKEDAVTKKEVVRILGKLQSLDLATTAMNKRFIDSPELTDGISANRLVLVQDLVKRLARLQSISPSPKALIALWSSGALSAAAVSQISIENLQHALGLSVDESAKIKQMAVNATNRNRELAANLRSSITQPGFGHLLGMGSKESRVGKARDAMVQYGMKPTIEGLLGSLDYGLVNEAQTVYSPTAYFVDLLQYLRKSKTDGTSVFDNSRADEAASFRGTALQALYRRRPDLLHMNLSPENTTTVLPYIDLVNEVMESFVSHLPDFRKSTSKPRQARIDAYNVDDRDSQDLLAQPQNFKIEAYRQLAGAVYPTQLPYHQPLDAQRAFLTFLGTTRLDLVTEFRAKAPELNDRARNMHQARLDSAVQTESDKAVPSNADTHLAKLQEHALEAQQDCEVLGICQEEYLIWTKGVFWEKDHFVHTEGLPSLSDDEYRRRVGLKDPWHCYGYSSAKQLLSLDDGPSQVKAELLPRLGISYAALVEVMQTKFCNPSSPVGRDKLIMEELRFSYRHLQAYVDSSNPNSYDLMARFLTQNDLLMVHFRNTSTRGNTGSAELLATETASLRDWLAQNFESLGKIAVLEKGGSPTLEVTGQIVAKDLLYTNGLTTNETVDFAAGRLMLGKTRYQSAVIAQLDADGSITRPDGTRVGSVDLSGRVSYGPPSPSDNISTRFPSLRFTVNAVGGQWQIIDGILCKEQPFEQTELWVRKENMGDANIDNTRLTHLDGSSLTVDEWDRIHLFARVWRTLKWSVPETDRALLSAWKTSMGRSSPIVNGEVNSDIVGPTDNEDAIKFNDFVDADGNLIITPKDPQHSYELPKIDSGTVKELAALVQIINTSGLPVEDILTIWSPMSSVGPKSQYNKLFRRRNLRQIHGCFEPDRNGNLFTALNLKITTQRLTVIAALNLSNTDLDYLLSTKLVEDKLNLQSLSRIYAHSLVARILSVKITDLSQVYQAFGSPFDSPTKALDVLKQWQKVAVTAVPWQELRFILDSVLTPDDPLALTRAGSLRVSKQLCDAVLKVHKDHPPVSNETQLEDLVKTAEARLGLLLEDKVVKKVLQLLQGNMTWETEAPFVDQELFKIELAKIKDVTATYTAKRVEPTTKDEPISKPEWKCSFGVTGILNDDQFDRILDAAKVIFQPDLRRGTRGASKSVERFKNAWRSTFDKIKQQPVKLLLDTLTGVLPRNVLEDEIFGRNRNILAPDAIKPVAKAAVSGVQVTTGTRDDVDDDDTMNSASTSLFTIPDGLSSTLLQNGSNLFVRPSFTRSARGSAVQSVVSLDSEAEFDSDDDISIRAQAVPEADDGDEEDFSGARDASEKLRFILVHLTPFLHRRLTYNSVIDTLASVSGFTDTELAKMLLENVLTARRSQDIKLDQVEARIVRLLDALPQRDTALQAPKTPYVSTTEKSKNSEMAKDLFKKVYKPFMDKEKTYSMVSLLDQVMIITKEQSFSVASALLDNITALAPVVAQSALDFVMKSVSDSVNYWQGYLQPPESGEWVFEWRDHGKPEDLFLTEFSYTSQLDASLFVPQGTSSPQHIFTFTQKVDESGRDKRVKYVSNSVSLQADKKYAVRLTSAWIGNKNFLWRSSELADPKAVPKSALKAWWKGYLYPSIRDVYTFSVKNTASDAVMILNNERQRFIKQSGDSQGDIWSAELNQMLDASTLHMLELHGCTPSELMWKIGGNSLVTVPDSALLPEIAPAQMHVIFLKMKKLALVFKHLPLSPREVLFMHSQETCPHLDGIRNIEEWRKVQDYVMLRKSLTSTASRSLSDLFSWAASNPEATQAELRLQLCSATGWPEASVQTMLTKANFTTGKPADFRNAEVLCRFQKLMGISVKLDVDVATLFEWATPMGTATDEYSHYHSISQDIQRMAKAKFDSDTWVKAVRAINNKLRESQSKALVSFLLVQKELTEENGIHDADGLFEYFLIDVQMTSLVETSRVVQATSSVQLFIQRCFLGLEAERGVTSATLDRNRWSWMEKYRVWEANRKIYLYPENWIEPSLRDDKTEQFKELESELLQKNITAESVDSAIKRYVSNVANISSVEAIALYLETLSNPAKSGQLAEVSTRVHVFARTRTSPYAYLYNNFTSAAGLVGYWAGWQDLKIEIPHMIDPRVADTAGGSQLAPIIFQGRLVLFVAEFISKQIPQPIPNKGERGAEPKQGWDIRMSFTECRDGRWIPRQSCPLAHTDETAGRTPGGYVLIPSAKAAGGVPLVSVTVLWSGTSAKLTKLAPTVDTTEAAVTTWTFDGIQFKKLETAEDQTQSSAGGRYFGVEWNAEQKLGHLNTFQGGKAMFELAKIESGDSPKATFTNGVGPSILLSDGKNPATTSKERFYSAMSGEVMAASAETSSSAGIFARMSQIGSKEVNSKTVFDPDSADLADIFGAFRSKDDKSTWSFNEQSKLYSLYNWELGLHIPMITIEKLLQSQQYEQALRLAHTIFDPSVKQTDDKDDARRCWKFVPFKVASTVSVTQMLMRLNTNEDDIRIQEWRDKPFLPHLVARSRPQAYMRWVLSTYIKILIAWGDSLFKQNTLESIPQAIQLYVLASHVYGPRGEAIPRQKQVQPQSFWSLCKRFDDFSNAMVELEQAFPYSQQTPLSDSSLFDEESTYTPTIFGSAETLYFSIPDNPTIRALASTIDDRLFKIRNSQDINGTFRKLPLSAPPIDPALLVQATAQGLSLESVLQDLQAPLPNCKVSLLFTKAFELISEVRNLGQSLLSIREKKDVENLSLLRHRHELALQNSIMEAKNLQLNEASQALENLTSARTAAISRLTYYFRLVDGDLSGIPTLDAEFQELDTRISKPITEGGLGLSDMENESMTQSENAAITTSTSNAILTAAGLLDFLPNISVQAQPLGVGATVSVGPSNIAAGFKTAANVIGLAGDILRHKAGMASTKAGYQRAMQERIMQANSAGYEVININKQILSAKIRIAIAKKEISMQQFQIDQAHELANFHREKFATKELYAWMDGVTKMLYHQCYTQAFEVAKQAELALKFERPQQHKEMYIQAGYFDSAHDGLLAGENLYHDLKRLEMVHLQERGYDFEVMKSISLRLLDPMQLLELRQTGSCEFSLDELLFDMDFPGHFLRRIKGVSVTIPCVVGPYTTINGTLTLQRSEMRVSSAVTPGGGNYARSNNSPGAAQDERFRSVSAPIKAVAVCSGQNDAGVFQLDFHDSSTRYLPFEGAGVISTWKLELPQLRQFDYDTIFDVVLQMRYTSLSGGERMKIGAQKAVNTYLKASETTAQTTGRTALIDIRAEHATAWSAIRDKTGVQTVELGDVSQRLPYFTQWSKPTLTISSLTVLADGPVKKCDIMVDPGQAAHELTEKSRIGELTGWSKKSGSGSGNSEKFGKKWSLKIDVGGTKPRKCLLIVDYLTSL